MSTMETEFDLLFPVQNRVHLLQSWRMNRWKAKILLEKDRYSCGYYKPGCWSYSSICEWGGCPWMLKTFFYISCQGEQGYFSLLFIHENWLKPVHFWHVNGGSIYIIMQNWKFIASFLISQNGLHPIDNSTWSVLSTQHQESVISIICPLLVSSAARQISK